MTLQTRLTHRLNVKHPIVLAPMDLAANARLANAVAAAGGLGLLGGGYGDLPWLQSELPQLDRTPGRRIGVGFITWSLARHPALLDEVLKYSPEAVFLSFGDPTPFARKIKDSGAALICQVGSVEHAKRALDAGADILSAQGTEGGGHALGTRSTLTLVPELADLIRGAGSPALLLAGGGIADARGLAAALALGADGALVGTRFWASTEAAASRAAQELVLRIDGDSTVRQTLYDTVREKHWPEDYNGRVLLNDFLHRWLDHPEEFIGRLSRLRDEYHAAAQNDDLSVVNVIVGEAIGMIHSIQTVRDIVESMSEGAAHLLNSHFSLLPTPSH
ncbi:nitronate monooxygenase [Paenarthrobacter sp. NPDC089316]|uniref:NAD(P)H-dependent flavin oxidoreductase n=1 Tax=unclassified Paenarthrobacter TaxID=2634190 RepID=UPI003420B038